MYNVIWIEDKQNYCEDPSAKLQARGHSASPVPWTPSLSYWHLSTAELHSRQRPWITHVEDLEAGDVEDAEEGGALPLGAVQRAVDAGDQPLEQTLVARLRDRLDRKLHLYAGVSGEHTERQQE